MNRLKQLRQSKHMNAMELVESIRHISPTITVKEWLVYENDGIRKHNDKFWQEIANYFEVSLGYLYGYTKIQNEDYIVDLQEVLHRETELKLEVARLEMENNLLTDENKRLNRDLNDVYIIVEDYRERNHLNG